MSVTDFLFGGQAPPSVTTYGATASNMPQWLSDYTQALIARANETAGESYTPYGGPRIAGFTPDQLAGFEAVKSNQGSYLPWLSQAGNLATQAGNTDVVGAATPGLNEASSMYGDVANLDPAAAASPYMTAAGKTFPEAVDDYMNPYVQNVIDRSTQEALRNWNEQINPSIQAQFIRGGQYGSTEMAEKLGRAGRDVSEGIQSQANAALADAYNTAGSLFGADASRQGTLAQLAGQLETQKGQLGLDAAAGKAGIGTALGQLTGQQAQLGLDASTKLGALGQLQQQLGLTDAASLQNIGQQEQAMNQANLDLAYQDFLNQKEYPWEMINRMNAAIQGIPYNTSTTSTSTGPASAYQPSGLSQLLASYGGIRDIIGDFSDLFGFNEGGRVPPKRITKAKAFWPVKRMPALAQLAEA